jgi:DNA repair ATPase RecN
VKGAIKTATTDLNTVLDGDKKKKKVSKELKKIAKEVNTAAKDIINDVDQTSKEFGKTITDEVSLDVTT